MVYGNTDTYIIKFWLNYIHDVHNIYVTYIMYFVVFGIPGVNTFVIPGINSIYELIICKNDYLYFDCLIHFLHQNYKFTIL